MNSPVHLLITATGYCENTNMGWKNAEKSAVGRDWGSAPSLVEGIHARITLPLPLDQVQASALDERGQRKAPIPIERDTSGNAVMVIGAQWQTLWYEVTAGSSKLIVASTIKTSTASSSTSTCNVSTVVTSPQRVDTTNATSLPPTLYQITTIACFSGLVPAAYRARLLRRYRS
jgi:hypothetical protein